METKFRLEEQSDNPIRRHNELSATASAEASLSHRETITSPSSTDQERLLAQAKVQAARWKRLRTASGMVCAWAIIIGLICLIGVVRYLVFNEIQTMFLMSLSAVASLAVMIGCFKLRPGRKNPIHLLCQSDNINAVGPLIDAMQLSIPEITNNARTTLLRLLPRLTSADYYKLNRGQRDYLNSILNVAVFSYAYDRDLTQAALMALSKVGDETAIPYVKRLAMNGVVRNTAVHYAQRLATYGVIKERDAQTRQMAMECLNALDERSKNYSDQLTCLRSASAPETPGDALLRPTSISSPSDPSQLLRPDPTQP